MRPARRPPAGRTRRARLVADAALAVATRSDCNARLPLTHELALGVGVEKRGATGRSGNVRYWEIPFYTCGDPVCGGHTPHPGVPPCSAGDVAGAACSPEGATCDPGDACNRLLVRHERPDPWRHVPHLPARVQGEHPVLERGRRAASP